MNAKIFGWIGVGLFLFSFKGWADSTLEIVESEPFNILVFIESINNEPGRSTALKSAFDRSRFNTKANQALFIRFRDLSAKFRDEYEGDPTRQISFDKEILEKAVVRLPELQFLNWLKGKLKKSHYAEFAQIYREIKPIYKSLIGDPLKSPLQTYKQSLNEPLAKWLKGTDWTCQARVLDAPEEFAIRSPVAMYPLPSGREVLGESFVGIEAIGLNPKRNDYDGDLSVIFHEKVHTLFFHQKSTTRKNLRKWLKVDDESEASFEKFMAFEEALVIGMANVWNFEKVTGQKPSEPWYADPQIDAFAKRLFPLLRPYLEDCKVLDE